MKAIFINGSPRKGWNTHKLIQCAEQGAKDAGAETEVVNLYDVDFKGCVSCFACKVKGNTTNGVCAYNDDLKPVMQRIMEADVLVVASPIYFGDLTGETISFLERLRFPVLKYMPALDGVRPRALPKEKKFGMIFTMNVGEELAGKIGYKDKFESVASSVSDLIGNGEYKTLWACNTYQFSDYSKYEADMFSEEDKREHRENQFPIDMNKAYEMGRKLCEE